MFSSEQQFSINGANKDHLTQALTLATEMHGLKINAYTIENNQIIFYWHPAKNTNTLPTTTSIDTLINLTWDHLQSPEAKNALQKEPQDDIDGTINTGWEIFVPTHKHTPDYEYTIIGVKLTWLYYHQ